MIGRVLFAGLAAGVVGVFTSWLLMGKLFHPYQARTPGTWRAQEGPIHYAAASALTIVASLVITGFFALTGGIHVGTGRLAGGLLFGVLCWAAFALPVLLSQAVFVNLHRGVIVGSLLDWLVVAVLAGGAAGLIVPA